MSIENQNPLSRQRSPLPWRAIINIFATLLFLSFIFLINSLKNKLANGKSELAPANQLFLISPEKIKNIDCISIF